MRDAPASDPVAPAPLSGPATGSDARVTGTHVETERAACPNCGSLAVERFCAACGERQPSHHDFSVAAMLADTFHELTSVDGRLLRSVAALLLRPGFLTQEWFAGRRGRYVKPLSLFVMLNLLFFVIQPHTGLLQYKLAHYVNPGGGRSAAARAVLVNRARAESGESPEIFRQRFESTLQNQKKSLLIVSIPLFAIALALLYVGRHRYFVEHLVTSLHFYTYFLVFAMLVTPLFGGIIWMLTLVHAPRGLFLFIQSEPGLMLILALVLGSYLFLTLRRVYGDRPLPALLRASALVFVHQYLIFAYHDVLFYSTLYSLSV